MFDSRSLLWFLLPVILLLPACDDNDDGSCSSCSSHSDCPGELSCFRFSDGLNRCANRVGDKCASFFHSSSIREPAPDAGWSDGVFEALAVLGQDQVDDWMGFADLNDDGLADVVVFDQEHRTATVVSLLLSDPEGQLGHAPWQRLDLGFPPGAMPVEVLMETLCELVRNGSRGAGGGRR